MILYHFTAISLLSSILKDGLTKGEVPITATQIETAVWFTTDKNPSGHGLSDAGEISDLERKSLEALSGRKFNHPIYRIDKRRVCIKVVIPTKDRALYAWLPWARKRLDREWMDTLTEVGGGKAKAETWFIYRGVVPPSLFKEILIRGADDQFAPITDADRAEAEATSQL